MKQQMELFTSEMIKEELSFCQCGDCGLRVTKLGNRFIQGHYAKTAGAKKRLKLPNEDRKVIRVFRTKFCKCNCGGQFREDSRHPKDYISGHNRRGAKHTEESKKKMGWPEGVRFSEEHKQKLREVYDYDKIFTEETRRKLRESKGGENNPMFGRTGEKSPNWQGGTSNFPYPFEFNGELKEFIRERDNNTCQLCGKIKEKDKRTLCVHHINHDIDDLFELNLITLCNSCNGKVNSRRDFWEDYFTFKLMTYTRR